MEKTEKTMDAQTIVFKFRVMSKKKVGLRMVFYFFMKKPTNADDVEYVANKGQKNSRRIFHVIDIRHVISHHSYSSEV